MTGKTIAPERLLVFNIREGWEPLCTFLVVPLPQHEPFPRVNDIADLKTDIRERFG
jgi:hypothetical protein